MRSRRHPAARLCRRGGCTLADRRGSCVRRSPSTRLWRCLEVRGHAVACHFLRSAHDALTTQLMRTVTGVRNAVRAGAGSTVQAVPKVLFSRTTSLRVVHLDACAWCCSTQAAAAAEIAAGANAAPAANAPLALGAPSWRRFLSPMLLNSRACHARRRPRVTGSTLQPCARAGDPGARRGCVAHPAGRRLHGGRRPASRLLRLPSGAAHTLAQASRAQLVPDMLEPPQLLFAGQQGSPSGSCIDVTSAFLLACSARCNARLTRRCRSCLAPRLCVACAAARGPSAPRVQAHHFGMRVAGWLRRRAPLHHDVRGAFPCSLQTR